MTEAHRPEPDLVLLHTLRCIGVAGEERVATAAGLDPKAALAGLQQLLAEEFVESGDGPFGGWSLTDRGRDHVGRLLVHELEMSGAREDVERGYHSFLRLNPVFLGICSDWQMRNLGGVPSLNDHSDPDHDAGVLSRLLDVDDEIEAICHSLASRLTRFAAYRPRFSSALDRVLAGSHRDLADDIESYHTVWFQLHEDLLATLGISREEERGH